jgi:hypothetical protein
LTAPRQSGLRHAALPPRSGGTIRLDGNYTAAVTPAVIDAPTISSGWDAFDGHMDVHA